VPTSGHATDCEGDWVLPGFIELHTDSFERHLEPRPGIFWSADRAILSHDAEMASAGITTAFDAVTLGNDIGQGFAQGRYIEFIAAAVSARAEGLLRVEHELHLRCEVSSSRMRDYLNFAVVHRIPRLVSLMDHTPGQGQWTDVGRFREHYVRRYGLTNHQVDALINLRQQSRDRFAAPNRRAVLDMAHRHSCALASHDDATESDIETAHADACDIAEFPTSLSAARLARDRGMYVVAGAPNLIRGSSHSGNVAAAALVREGLCEILSSDYYPSSLLQAVFELARNFDLSLPSAVATATSVPARALGLPDRGAIEEGKRADLVRVRETPSGPIVVSTWCAGRQVA
jgi:alpha-D-ribose 1-methylphosphonate 5-triphosphate diphosphatase